MPARKASPRVRIATFNVNSIKSRLPALLQWLEEMRPHIEAGALIVTQGFIGATAHGEPTVLGRGGSDFTAALLGAALDAERVEIWTDVSGLMTADPRIVPDAQVLAEATYDEAAMLHSVFRFFIASLKSWT